MALLVFAYHGSKTMQFGSLLSEWYMCHGFWVHWSIPVFFLVFWVLDKVSVVVVPMVSLLLVVQSTWPIKLQFHTGNQPSHQRCSFIYIYIYIYSFKCHNGLESSFLFFIFWGETEQNKKSFVFPSDLDLFCNNNNTKTIQRKLLIK